MMNSLLKRLKFFKSGNWKSVKNYIHPKEEFCIILDRERDRVDRHNGAFSIVSFKLQEKKRSNKDFQELLFETLISRLRKVDDIGWCCDSHISVMLHNTESHGARCYAKGIIDTLDNGNNDITYSVYTYPDDSNTYSSDNCSTKRFHFNGTPGGARNGFLKKTFFAKHVEDKKPVLSKFVSSDVPGAHGCSIMRNKNLFTKKVPAWKRIVDIVGSIVLILIFSPVMLATAIAIKLTSKGPVIFRQQRAGIGGTPFVFYKFRSMVVNSEEKKKDLLKYNLRTGPVFKMENDPRVTIVGKIIRKWSIDEMLQFFNVLKGDMSLVGPRPPTVDEVPQYFNWHNRRLDIKPGITCIWQVYARHNKCFESWVRLDIEYARSQSFFLDLKILFLTLPAIISQKGAH